MEYLNHQITGFHECIGKKVETGILDIYHEMGTTPDSPDSPLNFKDLKIFFINYTVQQIINDLQTNPNRFYIAARPTTSEIHEWFEKKDWEKIYFSQLKKIFQTFPVKGIIIRDQTFHEFLQSEDLEEKLFSMIKKSERTISRKKISKAMELMEKHQMKTNHGKLSKPDIRFLFK